MSLYRYLPTPSDRMGIIWTLLSAEGAVVLEYGPAGTTHYSVGMYGSMGVAPNQSLFTTHLSEDDIVMGDVTRLEEAIIEVDKEYHPEVIFVVSSSVASIIGTDIKGVCNYMKHEVNARLIPVDTGGFKGDYTCGMREGYSLLVKTFCKEAVEKKTSTYNILGASGYHYRMKSDIWEIKNLMKDSFDYECNGILGIDSSVTTLKNFGAAEVNLVLRQEALPAAEYLKETYGTPYIYGAPYGYQGTTKWLEEVAKVTEKNIADEVQKTLSMRKMESAGYKMYAAMYASKEITPAAVVAGDYDMVKGFSNICEEIALPVELKVSNHSLAGLEAEDMMRTESEKEKIELLTDVKYRLVFGDDISLHMCDDTNEKVICAYPLIGRSQIATHIPFMGIRGMDYLLETVERYYSRL